MKEHNLVNTYFYDYHELKMSCETSEIILKSLEIELQENNRFYDKNDEKTIILTHKIDSRKNIIKSQKDLLEEMKKTIDSFPKTLKGVKYIVYYLRIIENMSCPDIAKKCNYTL